MLVTRIQDISKKRYRIWLDDEAAFVLYKGDLRRYRIGEGVELERESYDQIQKEVLCPRAEKRALHLLEKRDYTTEALRRKLLEGGYSAEIAQKAVQKMQEYRYLDDERYAEQYIRCYVGRKTRRAISCKLLEKGISKEIIESAYAVYEGEGTAIDEAVMAKELLKKRHYEGEPVEKKELDRHIAYLMRRGFSASNIQKAVRSLQGEYGEKTEKFSYSEDLLDIISENS